MAAFTLAYLAECGSHKLVSEDVENKLKEIASEVENFEDDFPGEDTPEIVCTQFIQAYNNLKEITTAYNDVEYC